MEGEVWLVFADTSSEDVAYSDVLDLTDQIALLLEKELYLVVMISIDCA